MLLSVVTGTYNRHEILKKMMKSVRDQIPRHISYQFVIIDGGSEDGTLEWLREQPDVLLIEHSSLKGAIRAFCEGAILAQGEYVLMANDDVEFHPYSIVRAIAHLEDSPTCGGVAFADNRSQQIGAGAGHRTEVMPATSIDGTPTHVNYAQVGLFRKWLGNHAGWWGYDDPIMGQARTYGGDNYLSSRIWEEGYTIDAVPECRVDDLIARDDLRRVNAANGRNDSQLYYQRYPEGAQLCEKPKIDNPQKPRLRILVCPIYEKNFPGWQNKEDGLSEALSRVGLTYEIDYVNQEMHLESAVMGWQPDILITQFHDANHITPAQLAAARAAQPEMVVVNWNGDAHEKGLISPEIIELLRVMDLQTVVNAKVLPEYENLGIRAAYWQIGYKDPAEPHKGKVPNHDVLFLGNCYNDERYMLVGAISAFDKYNVGVYGACPGAIGNTHYDFALSRALYENCQIAISDTYPNTEGYVSNRLFQALSAGSFVLQQHSPRLEDFTGLKANKHYIEWDTLADLRKKIKLWMRPSKRAQRDQIAAQGKEFVRKNFSYDAQVGKLWDLLP